MDKADIKEKLSVELRESGWAQEISFDETADRFMITTADKTKFTLLLREVESVKKQEEDNKEVQEYIKTHTKDDFIHGLSELSRTNTYMYFMVISLLKMQELKIITNDTAESLCKLVAMHEDQLKQDSEKLFKISNHE